LAGIGGDLAPGWQLKSGLIEIILRIGLPGVARVFRAVSQHPLAVIERVGLALGLSQAPRLGPGPCRIDFARLRLDQDGAVSIVGRGHNRRVQENDPSVHGETDAFRKAGRQRRYQDTIMVTTLAPCWYCSGLVRQFNIGTVIIGEGESGTRMFFLSAGHVVVVKAHGSAQPVTLARLSPGEFFGEMSLVESVTRSASVVATDAVTACTLKGADFHRLYQHRPEQYGIVMLNLARDLARRLRALDERFSHISH
jgi:tRNA(Arg) A34 adenosine deaminase TadA